MGDAITKQSQNSFIISLGIKIGKQIAQTVWHLISLQLQAGVLLILKYGFHNKHREYSVECKNICSKRILIYTRAVEVTKRNELLLIFKKNNLSVQVWVLGMFKLYILGLWFYCELGIHGQGGESSADFSWIQSQTLLTCTIFGNAKSAF